MGNENNREGLYILMIACGVFLILPIGILLTVMFFGLSLVGGGYQYTWLIGGLIALFLGFFCILYPKKYKIRFIVGGIMSFISSSIFLTMAIGLLPAITQDNMNTSAMITTEPQVSSTFLENFSYFLGILFAILGIILVILYIKRYLKEKEQK